MKPQITVVGLGPDHPRLMTLQTCELLKECRQLVLRTERHPVAQWLKEQGIAYETLDAMYDAFDDFDEMHSAMAHKIWQKASLAPLVYAVPDPACDGSVAALMQNIPDNASIQCLPCVSLADRCLSQLPGASSAGVRIVPALGCEKAGHHPALPLLVTELDQRTLAGDVKLFLQELYGDEKQVIFFPSTVSTARAPVQLALTELDRQKTYDHTVCVFIPASPPDERERFCFDDLLEVMERLRGENGDPWDLEQTHESLRRYLIEEAWETSAAIEEDDPDHLFDELGDVLLQVVFHAHIGKTHGEFTIGDVTTAICGKMIHRHPHIFGTSHYPDADHVYQDWEKFKKEERGLTTQASVLEDVPKGLPALMRAAKVQKKAAQAGFEHSAKDVLPSILEEANAAFKSLDAGRDCTEQLGQLLFSCVRAARLCGKDPEMALRAATDQFIRRFSAMENLIISQGKSLEDLTLPEMDVYWKQVKAVQTPASH